MITNVYNFDKFPYDGSFYRINLLDSEFINKGESTKEEIFKCKCDFQEVSLSKDQKSFDEAKYVVYFEIPKNEDGEKKIIIKNGDIFKVIFNGLSIEGKVTGILPTMLGCKVYIADDVTQLERPSVKDNTDGKNMSDLDSQYYG